MISSIQRISSATVTINGIDVVAKKDNGLLVPTKAFGVDMQVLFVNDITVTFMFRMK